MRTPNLDRLAADGLRFTRFYNTARCWPTRSAILSGYYHSRFAWIRPTTTANVANLLPHQLRHAAIAATTWASARAGRPRPVADGASIGRTGSRTGSYFSPSSTSRTTCSCRPSRPTADTTRPPLCRSRDRVLRDHASRHADQPFFLYLASLPALPAPCVPDDIAECRDRYLEGWMPYARVAGNG